MLNKYFSIYNNNGMRILYLNEMPKDKNMLRGLEVDQVQIPYRIFRRTGPVLFKKFVLQVLMPILHTSVYLNRIVIQ